MLPRRARAATHTLPPCTDPPVSCSVALRPTWLACGTVAVERSERVGMGRGARLSLGERSEGESERATADEAESACMHSRHAACIHA
jgi:hypothetical protein